MRQRWQDPAYRLVQTEHLRAFQPPPTLSGPANGRWKGGRSMRMGYVIVRVSVDRYRHEHRLIAERALGRPLAANECVHHIDGVKTNNSSNLLICSTSFHQWLENRLAQRRNPEKFSRDRLKGARMSNAAQRRNPVKMSRDRRKAAYVRWKKSPRTTPERETSGPRAKQ
jgi:hypothetical protein